MPFSVSVAARLIEARGIRKDTALVAVISNHVLSNASLFSRLDAAWFIKLRLVDGGVKPSRVASSSLLVFLLLPTFAGQCGTGRS